MKRITAIVRAEKLEALKEALFEAHVRGMTIVQVQGCGNSHGWTEYVRGRQVPLNTIPKVQFDLVVDDSQVDDIVAVICAAARTPSIGSTRRRRASSYSPNCRMCRRISSGRCRRIPFARNTLRWSAAFCLNPKA